MRKIVYRRSRKALTLVELVVAMVLMALFLVACTSLIYPVTRIYTHMTNLSRSQIVADNVVDALRTECARTYISSKNDVWISGGSGDATMTAIPGSVSGPGEVLVIRRNYEYCETLSTNYAITPALCNSIYNSEKTEDIKPLIGSTTSRAIYRMFTAVPATGTDAVSQTGYLHYGFFKAGTDSENGIYPSELYDFTDPFMTPTYSGFTVKLMFHNIKYDSSGKYPVYVLVDVKVMDGEENVYTRSNVVLSFASRVLE